MCEESRIDIGFLERKESWLLHPRFFPCKVGGLPAWLNLQDLPSPSDLKCQICEDPMIFLCQVYAPFEESDECFHRTIFIFICRKGSCCRPNSAENLLVLRSQLPRKNIFYCYEPPQESNHEEFKMDKWCKLCSICGARAPAHCSKCKNVYYCSRKHQIMDWQKGHKQTCGQGKVKGINEEFIPSEAAKSILFEEWEIVIDEEDEEEKTEVNVESELEKMQKLLKEKRVSLNDVEEREMEQFVSPVEEDRVFSKFSRRVSRAPRQVLRYSRAGDPLHITRPAPHLTRVPDCPYCNAPRQFEFQVMPQLLNYMRVGAEVDSIDWGVLCVYTCSRSCAGAPEYKREHLLKQDLLPSAPDAGDTTPNSN